ncbi:hypothetical protein CGRA01v4_04377 [Colletotrichum graminicola]|nr:hypothetical protein CGRA01v4_04377 [Colletotrichum graminicola]
MAVWLGPSLYSNRGWRGRAPSHMGDMVPGFSEDEFREILESEWGHVALKKSDGC